MTIGDLYGAQLSELRESLPDGGGIDPVDPDIDVSDMVFGDRVSESERGADD